MEIQLSQGQFAIVDDIDFEYLSKYKWSAFRDGRRFYAHRNITIDGKHTTQKMHHAIMGDPNGRIIDHIDGNGLNNTRANLRWCSRAENSRNARPNPNAYSKYKGVWFNKLEGKYMAGIMVDRTAISLGYFISEIDAALAYNKAALAHHGEFAYQNIIPE